MAKAELKMIKIETCQYTVCSANQTQQSNALKIIILIGIKPKTSCRDIKTPRILRVTSVLITQTKTIFFVIKYEIFFSNNF